MNGNRGDAMQIMMDEFGWLVVLIIVLSVVAVALLVAECVMSVRARRRARKYRLRFDPRLKS